MKRVLIANRGEIAVRIARACRKAGLESVAVYSEADRRALHTRLADRAVCIGPAPAAQSYLSMATLIAAAKGTGCDAVHPGYGFLAENAAFAEACAEHGLIFVGPSPEAIRAMGDKVNARRAAAALGVPTVPGSPEPVADQTAAEAAAREAGFPVLLKAAAGGGGRGMRIVRHPDDLAEAFARASAESAAAFGDGRLYLERYLDDIRHIEVQVLADAHGTVVDLGERDCSVQRRHQKLIEEAPAPALDPGIRRAMADAATALVRAIGYRNAGTVEFVFDRPSGRFYFIEMNTRIQVEHPVSEMITGVDIVHEQLRIAAGARLDSALGRERHGHAIEFRLNAEDPAAGFRPSPGRITAWQAPEGEGIRIDTHCGEGAFVPPFYDSLLAKLIVHDETREAAIARATAAIERFRIEGVATTLPFHRTVAANADFSAAAINTRWVEDSLLVAA